MKISGTSGPHIDAASSARAVPQRSVSNQATRVAVSHEARALAEARSPATSDAAKVAKLTEAIAKGNFMVDAERLTDRMMTEER